MKLTGKVDAVERTVAKREADGTFDEKRQFKISARASTPLPSSYYGYGGMHFILNGRELADFGCDLGDEVEIFVVRKGEDYANRVIEDVSSALYTAEGQITALQKAADSNKQQITRHASEVSELRIRLGAMQQENIRLTTELETLKAVRSDLGAMVNLKQIGDAS